MRKGLKKCLFGTACAVLAVGVGLTARLFPVSAEKRAVSDKISYLPKDTEKDMGSAENPFTVLEIVPNQSMAMIGYMIPGCEPVDIAAIGADTNMTGAWQTMVDNGLYTKDEMHDYRFLHDLPKDAVILDWQTTNMNEIVGKWVKWTNSNTTRLPGYSEYGYYEFVGEGKGNFALADAVTYMEIEPETEAETKADDLPDADGLPEETLSEPDTETAENTKTAENTETAETAENTEAAETVENTEVLPEAEREVGMLAAPRAADAVFSYREGGAYNWVCVGRYYPAMGGNGTHNRLGNAQTGYTFEPAAGGAFSYEAKMEYDSGDVKQDLASQYWTYRTDEDYYCYSYWEYHNKDVFIEGTFPGHSSYGEEETRFHAQVLTVTPEQLMEDNLTLIDVADLIVFTAQDYGKVYWDAHNTKGEPDADGNPTRLELTPEETGKTTFLGANGNDISWEAALRIVDRMASVNPAAMILHGTEMYGVGLSANEKKYNVHKLYIMLMQYGAKAFKETFIKDTENFKMDKVSVDGREIWTGFYRNVSQGKDFTADWDENTFMTELGIGVMHESSFIPGNSSEVFGSIMTFNGDMSFLLKYTSPNTIAPLPSGNNPWNKPGTNDELFDYRQEQEGQRPGHVSMQQGTEYILQQSGAEEDVLKRKLHVLELQPIPKFIYGTNGWQLYYANLLPWFKGDLNEDLTVTPMTTYQFIGDTDDLNAEYDLLLVGGNQDESNGLNGYPGESENGLSNMIYTSTGSRVESVWADGAWSYTGSGSDKVKFPDGSDSFLMNARYSGNDLTKKKYEEIKDYLDAERPVILSAALYNGMAMNRNKIDQSSYLYQIGLMTYSDTKPNAKYVFKEGSYKDSKGYDVLKKVLTQEKCAMLFDRDEEGNLLNYPTEYRIPEAEGENRVAGTIPGTQYHETRDAAGRPVLQYEFLLRGRKEAAYEINLYIDRNGDGIYDGSVKEWKELLAAGKVANERADESVLAKCQVWDVTEGAELLPEGAQLTAGHRYKLICTLEKENGIRPWKLEVFDAANPSSRCSEINYTAVRVAEGKPIHVLQINPGWDMSQNTAATINFADNGTDAGRRFADYAKAVKDYQIDYQYLSNEEWYQKYGIDGDYAKTTADITEADLIKKWTDDLAEVDILVLGFQKQSTFTKDNVFYQGFVNFVNSGKCVFLSNDMVKDASAKYREAAYETMTREEAGIFSELRNMAGQRRRYYITADENSEKKNQYRYSGVTMAGQTKKIVVPSLETSKSVKFREKPGEAEQNIIRHYWTPVKTNVPIGDSSEIKNAGTYETDGVTFYMDYGSEMMDNSTQLLTRYSVDKTSPLYVPLDRVTAQSPSELRANPEAAMRTQKITLSNKGQMMQYPYPMGDTIEIGEGHAQYFQLDLEQRDDGDVTVWTTLSDEQENGIYSSRPKDARNHYYTYNRGNLLYTGLGNSSVVTDDEIKLFINMIVSAYRPPSTPPYLKVTEEEAAENGDAYTMYLMLMEAEQDMLPDGSTHMYDVDFEIRDENEAEKQLRTYYLQYVDAEGEPLEEQMVTAARDGSLLEKDESGNRYKVSCIRDDNTNGRYTLRIPYHDIKEDGEEICYLKLTAEYVKGTDTIRSMPTVTKIAVYPMPLFTLN